jgi:AraC-like DNA-binding protein
MGVAYERSIDFAKPAHVHDRHMIVCPRGSCRMSVGVAATRYNLDATRVLWVPRSVVHDNQSVSAVYDTFALYPSDSTMAAAMRESRLSRAEVHELETAPARLRRSSWLDDLLDRYFTLRVVSPARRTRSATFFESQILQELFRLRFANRSASAPAPTLVDEEPAGAAAVALRYIESNLFSELRLEDVARHARTSIASLLRHFRAAFKQTPYAYIRRRRIDEGRRLVAAGAHSITDVALIVGYEDVAAFSKAFRSRFGVAPSMLQRRRRRAPS